MMKQLHEYINKWSPCLWSGWNSIGFDFIMLQKENYRSLFPIYITNTNGNEHSDFLPVTRASKIFYPDSINDNFDDNIIYSAFLRIENYLHHDFIDVIDWMT